MGCVLGCLQEVVGWIPLRMFRDQSFVEIDHEIFSMEIPPFTDSRRAIVSSWERMCTSRGKPLGGISLPRKKCD